MELGLVALWLAVFLVFILVGMPIANVLFPRSPDEGAGLALPVVLVVFFFVAYSIGRISLDLAVWATVLVLIGLVAVAVRRGGSVDLYRYREIAIVFTVAYLLIVLVRGANAPVGYGGPLIEPGGGEKFLDFGMLKANLRAETPPPEDFWFAGEPVRYYYGGHLVVSQLVRLTRTAPGIAYNLGLAGFYATFVSAAYGLAGSIADVRGEFGRRAAVLAAIFVGVASNLMTPIRTFLAGLSVFSPGSAETIARRVGVWSARGRQDGRIIDGEFYFWDASGIIEGTINEFPLFAWLNGDLHAHMMSPPFTLLLAGVLLAYYRTPAEQRERRWALLFGLVPLLGAVLAVVHTWSFPATAGLTFLTVLLAPASAASLVPGSYRERLVEVERDLPTLGRFLVAGTAGLVAALVAVGWSLPFWANNASNRSLAVLPDRSSLEALLVVHGTFLLPFAAYLTYLGYRRYDLTERDVGIGWLFAGLLIVTALLADVYVLAILTVILMVGFFLGGEDVPDAWFFLGVLTVVAVVADVAVLVVAGPLLAAGFLLARPWDEEGSGAVWATEEEGRPGGDGASANAGGVPSTTDDSGNGRGSMADFVRGQPGFEMILLLAGAGLVLLVEFVYLEENAGPGRFNTVFKLYAQVWALWAVAAAVALGRLLQVSAGALSRDGFGSWRSERRLALRTAVVVLVVGASIYGILALGGLFYQTNQNGEFGTLDGTVYLERNHPDEAEAIRWLDRRPGTPTIVDRPGDWPSANGLATPYTWVNGPSSFTGVPTVAGWNHQIGYRSFAAFDRRAQDALAIYTNGTEERAQLLAAYDVEYMYVGQNECERYVYETTGEVPAGRCNPGRLPDYASEPGIEVAHESGSVIIYRIDQTELAT